MPFEPLTPEELEFYKEPCSDSEHLPPSYTVVYQKMKWVCPSCGQKIIIRPINTACLPHSFGDYRDGLQTD
jgi:predicted RNA-binding Zn-ribbon protein involved in translation (DUF1610 family)